MHRIVSLTFLALVLTMPAAPAAAETLSQVLAAPSGQRVYDLAKVLPQTDRARLRTRLQQMAKSGSGNGAIVVVQRVEGESIESFAKGIGNKWKLGGASQKKGFVIVAAIAQRRWRFETNRALRAKISDDEAKKLMQEKLVPAFRRKQYGQGLNAALIAIDAASKRSAPKQSHTAQVSTQPTPSPSPDIPLSGVFGLLVAIVIIFVGIPAFFSLIGLGLAGGGLTGGRHNNNRWGSHHHDSSWSSHTSHSTHSSHSDSGGGGGGGGGESGGSGGGGDGGGGASGGW
jgi:uncharacterized protein